MAAARDRLDHDDPAQGDPPGRVSGTGAVRAGRQPGAGPLVQAAAAHWAGRKAHIGGLAETTDDACYRAMDWLHQVEDPLEKEVFGQVANLLNLEVDLLFFDHIDLLRCGRGRRAGRPRRARRAHARP